MDTAITNTLDVINRSLDQFKSEDLGMVNGKIGVLIFYVYSFLDETKKIDKEKVKTLFDEILNDLNTDEEIDLSYAGGITGLLSLILQLKHEEKLDFFQTISFDDFHEPIFVQAKKWIEYDFIDNLYGTVGIIHYFNQLDGKINEAYISELIRLLVDRGIHIDPNNMAFINSFPNKKNQSFDFGFAHGLSGMLSVLLDVYEKQRCEEVLYPVITKCIHYILESKIAMAAEYGHYSLFPSIYNQDTKVYTINNRMAWCYGDLNQVLLLFKAGHILKRKEYTEYANVFGMATLCRKTKESTEVYDSTFCHGSSGLALIYLNLYALSNEDAYLKAHHFWIAETIRLVSLELDNNKYNHENAGSLLDGLTGTGLVLLSSRSLKNLTWSKFLFI